MTAVIFTYSRSPVLPKLVSLYKGRGRGVADAQQIGVDVLFRGDSHLLGPLSEAFPHQENQVRILKQSRVWRRFPDHMVQGRNSQINIKEPGTPVRNMSTA